MSFPMARVIRTLGAPATFTPAGGSAVSLRAKRVIGGRPLATGGVRINAATAVYHILRTDVAAPAAGDTITVSGNTATIDAVDPVERDTQDLLWQITAGWGVAGTWRRVSGAGANQHPPQLASLTAAAASAGASTLSLSSSFAVGKIAAGDGLALAGDVTAYVVGADVTAAGNGFAGVTVTPPLAADVSAGTAVTLSFSADKAVRVALADYEPQEIAGTVQMGDRKFVLRGEAVAAAGRTEVLPGDSFRVDGQWWRVLSAVAVHEGTASAWIAQVRK